MFNKCLQQKGKGFSLAQSSSPCWIWACCLQHLKNLNHVKPIYPCRHPSKPQASIFCMEPCHICIINNFPPAIAIFFDINLYKLQASFNRLIRWCCDSGYPWRKMTDLLLQCSHDKPNSPSFQWWCHGIRTRCRGHRVQQKGLL